MLFRLDAHKDEVSCSIQGSNFNSFLDCSAFFQEDFAPSLYSKPYPMILITDTTFGILDFTKEKFKRWQSLTAPLVKAQIEHPNARLPY
jgi:hypothetical protein